LRLATFGGKENIWNYSAILLPKWREVCCVLNLQKTPSKESLDFYTTRLEAAGESWAGHGQKKRRRTVKKATGAEAPVAFVILFLPAY